MSAPAATLPGRSQHLKKASQSSDARRRRKKGCNRRVPSLRRSRCGLRCKHATGMFAYAAASEKHFARSERRRDRLQRSQGAERSGSPLAEKASAFFDSLKSPPGTSPADFASCQKASQSFAACRRRKKMKSFFRRRVRRKNTLRGASVAGAIGYEAQSEANLPCRKRRQPFSTK